MTNYEILDLDGLRKRRTVADAIAVLQSGATFGDDDTAQIRVELMRLAPGKDVCAIVVVFSVPCSDKAYTVPLPSAKFFTAYFGNGVRSRSPVKLLHQAIVNPAGWVRLSNGETVRAVEIVPARLPLTPTELDRRIVRVALACCRTLEIPSPSERENQRRVVEKCYRRLRDVVPADCSADFATAPEIRLLDCSALADLRVPSLEAIAAHWTHVYPESRAPSRQKIANALADFRIRFPRH